MSLFDREGLNQSLVSHRELEYQRILSLLRCHNPLPPILLNGPTGSGKSSLCKLCFDSNDDNAFINVVFFCPGYKDSKQLLRALWQYIISKLPKATKNFQDLSNRKIADFKEFCDHFFDLVSNLPENIISVNILLDDIDLMEQKTALNLSSLPQFCHPMIKVFATMRTALSSTGLLINFSPYTEQQLIDILTSMARCHRQISKLADMAAFIDMIKETVPILQFHTKHIGELWSSLLSIWKTTSNQSASSSLRSIAVMKRAIDETTSLPCTAKSLSNTLILSQASLRGVDWEMHTSLTCKYLLLATFVVSHNHKKTDSEIMIGDIDKKIKKKQRKGSLSKDPEIQYKQVVGRQNFTLERLLATYSHFAMNCGITVLGSGVKAAHVYGRGGTDDSSSKQLDDPKCAVEEINAKYCDGQLMSSIACLESHQLLIRSAGWTLRRPVYVSSVSREMAEDIAKSIPNFSLQSFLQHSF